MKSAGYCIFETPIGICGIGWSQNGTDGSWAVSAFQLPEASRVLTQARLTQKTGASLESRLPKSIATIIERVQRHLRGDVQNFEDVLLDLSDAPPFAQRVYRAAQQVSPGTTTTYGAIAESMQSYGAARAVGQALGKNPIALIVPCHRVLAAGGKPGGFSAHGGRSTKARLLALEGVALHPPKRVRAKQTG